MKQLFVLGLMFGSFAYGINQPCDRTDNIEVNGIQYINVACTANCKNSGGPCQGKNTGARCSAAGSPGLCGDNDGDGQCNCDAASLQPVDPGGAGY